MHNEEGQKLQDVRASAHIWEVTAYALIIIVALLMRLWDLGSQAISFDEANHLVPSLGLSSGLGFQHNPLTHGPFQFHGISAMFFLFGDSDHVARLLSALFGTALVGIPYLLRQRLGMAGALVTAIMLALSPMMLFYSRYARNDIIMAVWALSIVVVMWRFLDEGKPRYLYLGALLLAFSFATKETTFIIVAIVGGYLLIVAATDWIPWVFRRRYPVIRPVSSDDQNEYTYWVGYGYSYGKPSSPHKLSEFSRAGVLLVVIATLAMPQGSAAVAVLQDAYQSRAETLQGHGIVLAYQQPAEGQTALYPVGSPTGDILFAIQDLDVTKGMVIATIVVIIAVWFSALIGITWDRRVWVRCAVLFYGVWLLLYTTFLTSIVGVGSGIWQSLGYWLAQQEVNRGSQPWYYYLVLAPIYELLPFLFCIFAVVYYVLKGNNFTRFLAYWVVLTFVLYSIAGEKMPWLMVNIALPMIVITGKLIGDVVMGVDWRCAWRSGGYYLVPIIPLFLYVSTRLLLYNIDRGNLINFLEFWSLLAFALILVGLGIRIILRTGAASGLRILVLSFAMVLLVFGFRTGWQATYVNGDAPIEMLVYAHTSGDVPRIMEEIMDVAEETGDGKRLRVTVDGMATVFRWYLRDFRNVAYVDLSELGDDELRNLAQPSEPSVLLVSSGNEARLAPYLEEHTVGREFLYLWWPAEGYKPCHATPIEPCLSMGEILGNVLKRDKWRQGLDYLVHRKTDIDFLFHRAVAYFP